MLTERVNVWRVARREGLVADEHERIGDHGAEDFQTTTLAAGQIARSNTEKTVELDGLCSLRDGAGVPRPATCSERPNVL